MEKLLYNFTILSVGGVWKPVSWSSGPRAFLYDFYMLFVMSSISLCIFMELIEALHSLGRVEDFVGTSFILLTVGNACYKGYNLITKREEIISNLEMLNNSVCLMKNVEEERLLEKFQRRIRNSLITFSCIVGAGAFAITHSSVIQNIPDRSLPFKVWIPFNYSSNRAYWCLYYHQIIAHSMAALISIGYDTMLPAVMLLICGQLQLQKFRFENMMDNIISDDDGKFSRINIERKFLKAAIHHHRITTKFAQSFNNLFSSAIFVQYSVSCVVIGLSIYRVAGMEIHNPEYPFAIFYTIGMTSEIFLYCWYGNEVITESLGITDAIYKMEWASLSIRMQNDLLIVMQITMKPIIFTSGKILILSVESFMGIMKLSYTAYNVLQKR